jgi:hypothetical protein
VTQRREYRGDPPSILGDLGPAASAARMSSGDGKRHVGGRRGNGHVARDALLGWPFDRCQAWRQLIVNHSFDRQPG